MAGTGNGGYDPVAANARLSERVEGQGKDIVDLRSNMNTGFQQINANINSLANETRNSIATLTASFAERARPQWQALGVALTFAALLGGLAYMPIREATSDLKSSVGMLADKMVTRQEMDWRSSRGIEDRTRQEAAIADLRASSVTRNEWAERNRARDQEVADLGRRVDELRQDVGSVYGTRDVIQDLKKEIDNLRQRMNTRGLSPPS